MIRRAWPLVLLLLAAAPGTARADAKTEARAHLDRATELHHEGKLAEVLQELTLAYSLDPQPDLLYAIAQVHVQLGQCAQAILFYERFLSTRPADVPAAAATEAIEVCRSAPGSVAPEASARPAPAPLPPRPERPGRWYADRLGGALLGGGVVLGVTAAVTYAAARSELGDAEAAADYRSHDELVGRARGKRAIAVALGAGAAALTGAAITRYLLRRREPTRPIPARASSPAGAPAARSKAPAPPGRAATRSVAESRSLLGVAPASGGCLVTWSGRF